MYHNCIFCSAELGSNEVLEAFPVGSRLAFDSWKGRLWAVCPRCRRWNLAPLEERWEAVEDAERQFRDSRVRVHSENVGLARMPDGTRLIRVGEAVPLELATWRYGQAIGTRRRRVALGMAATTVGASALLVGAPVLIAGAPILAAGAVPAAIAASQLAGNLLLLRHTLRPVLRVPPEQSPTGKELVLRQQYANHLRVVESQTGGGVAVEVPAPLPLQRVQEGGVVRWVHPAPMRLEGELARRLLERTLVNANVWSAGRGRLEAALQRLDQSGGPDGLLRTIGRTNGSIFPGWMTANPPPTGNPRGALQRLVGSFRGERIAGIAWKQPPSIPREEVLALEIALHEDAERRALAGELAGLEAAWREAEEIAAIADTLPDDPLDRLRKE